MADDSTSINPAPSLGQTQSKQPTSSHRLPTVSASEALQTLQSGSSRFVTTGLRSLDALLVGNGDSGEGGLERGKVTELWGPSGAGKTAVALQLTTNALKKDGAVMWADATESIRSSRVNGILSAGTTPETTPEQLEKFHHMTVSTLSHLLALVLHPPPDIFPPDLSLLVIDNMDTLVNLDYPRYQTATSSKPDQQKWQASRRYAVLGSLTAALNKIALVHNLAIVITTGCSTRTRSESGLSSALAPNVGGAELDSGIWNRLVVFRDFSGRFIGIQKCQGRSLIDRNEIGETGRLIGFDIGNDGILHERHAENAAEAQTIPRAKPRSSPVKSPKRPFDEIADSEDEDLDEYGWIDADEHALVGAVIDDERQTTDSVGDAG